MHLIGLPWLEWFITFVFCSIAVLLALKIPTQALNLALALFHTAIGFIFQGVKIFFPNPYEEMRFPFQLCDFAAILCSFALWTEQRWMISCLFFWGLTLSTQGILTPDAREVFPHWNYIRYWYLHISIVSITLYLIIKNRFLPTWEDFWTTCFITSFFYISVFCANLLLKTNYMYLREKPPVPTLLDVLGTWPWYVFNLYALVFIAWMLLTAGVWFFTSHQPAE